MIAIVDYQMGNLRSVQKGFEKVGYDATITSSPEEILQAEKLVLPGVGAFADAMHELRQRDLVEPLCEFVQSGRPFLGICLGLQLLFDRSYEGGVHEGLGILPGEVVRFELPAEFKVPHMGWNQAIINRPAPIFDGIAEGTHFYFVHSYYAVPQDDSVTTMQANYHRPFCAAVWRDNLFATQFHPEKSQSHGLRILRNFAGLSVAASSSA